MNGVPILESLGEINPNWLSRVLSAQPDIGECQVVDLTRQDLNQGAGFVSQLVRVRMHYEDKPKAAPGSVIIKMAPSDAGTKEFGKLLGLFQREAAFYKYLATNNPCNPPRPYHIDMADSGDSFTFVIEDLGSHDQEKILDGCTPADAHAVLAALGKLHAKYWNSAGLEAHDWIPNPSTMAPALTAIAGGTVPGFLDRFGEHMGPELRASLEEALGVYGEMIEFAAKAPNQTLCHTDTHLGNILFQAGQPRFFDWQAIMIQSYSYDVAYFLNGNLATEVRRSHLEALLDSYFEALCAGGVRDLSREDVTASYHREAAGQLVTIPMIAGAFLTNDEKGHDMAAAWLPRFFSALEDSDAPKQLHDMLAEARA
ncbi:MAG: phosphotransferase [Rhodospirillaceae bacterium]|jgi:aminoglycoside/choline kinase family phosphotransferase|nr:phosphotransferase [Rhodospirillaceae bacterium]MBT5192337.1 phosphotransferase [Rhodospirillaceae bacterium]MBT5897483.1 phosphotransferase [Rhodospirillaceae bacterium]MBT7759105.1 phosphotransferase [Rhodospirillaceae bacterium]